MTDRTHVANRSRARLLIAALTALCLLTPGRLAAEPQEKGDAEKVARKLAKARGKAESAEAEREGLRHFREELADYAELHAKQRAKLGSHPESPTAQKAMADAIAEKRDKAKPGDIFRKDVQPLFRRLIAEQLNGPDTLDARKAVLDGNPASQEESVPVALRVNGVYPVGAPRSTVPASLLLTLPPLPEALHYRFVGRDLLLLDSVAQIIVDFLPAAAPELAVK